MHECCGNKEIPKVVCLLQLPPPVHGVSQINAYIVSHQVWSGRADLFVVEMNFANSLSDVRAFRFAKFATLFKVLYKQVSTLMKFEPKIAYFTFNPTGVAFFRDIIFLVILKLFGVKNIYLHLHGKGIAMWVAKMPWLKWLYKQAFKGTQLILISPKLLFDIEDVAEEKQVYYLPNAIPITINSDEIRVANERRLAREVPRLVFLSNMILSKGPLELLKAASLLRKRGIQFKVIFSGAWFHDNCKSLFYSYIADENLCDIVEYIGPSYGMEKKKLLLDGDIFVFPTYNDIFGIVNLEAMEAGLPVVSTFEGAISDIIVDGQTGYLVEKQNAEELSDRLAMLISDKTLRLQLGEYGRERVQEKFNFNHYAVSLADIILDECK